MMVLLCMCLVAATLDAQENLDLKGTSCVPVRTVSRDSLAFQAGERMDFVLHYRWGAINTDVGTATVTLDSLNFKGHEAFRCSVVGTLIWALVCVLSLLKRMLTRLSKY